MSLRHSERRKAPSPEFYPGLNPPKRSGYIRRPGDYALIVGLGYFALKKFYGGQTMNRSEICTAILLDRYTVGVKRKIEQEFKQFSQKEFNDVIDSAESDSENGRLTSANELKNEIDSWN